MGMQWLDIYRLIKVVNPFPHTDAFDASAADDFENIVTKGKNCLSSVVSPFVTMFLTLFINIIIRFLSICIKKFCCRFVLSGKGLINEHFYIQFITFVQFDDENGNIFFMNGNILT